MRHGRSRSAGQHAGLHLLVSPVPPPPPPPPCVLSPFHQPIFSVFLIRLSPIQPEMGRMGTHFSTKSGFQPTRTSMCFISSLISL